MSTLGPPPVRTALKSAITRAMKHRDREAAAVYRTALGAIDNAEAVPVSEEHRAGAIKLSPAGPGRADVPRRVLTEREMAGIVAAEAQERNAAAALLEETNPTRAQQLRREADLLIRIVRASEPG